MRLGLTLPSMASAAEDARLAESLGFHYVASGDHLFFHGPTPNAFVTLAAAAAATSRVRLLSSIALLPLYPAAIAAKLVAAVDNVSGGRFELGVGTGGEYPPEFAAVGIPVEERGRRLEESLEVMRLLFGGTRITFRGEFTRLDDVQLAPPPTQAHVPVWMGGRKEAAMLRAARTADVWMPYMVTPEMLQDGLATVRRLAAAEQRSPSAIRGALFAWVCVDDDATWAKESGTRAVSTVYAQDFAPLAPRYLVLGSVDDVVERLRAYAAAGAESIIVAIAARAADRDRVLRTLGDRVLPRVASF